MGTQDNLNPVAAYSMRLCIHTEGEQQLRQRIIHQGVLQVVRKCSNCTDGCQTTAATLSILQLHRKFMVFLLAIFLGDVLQPPLHLC